MEKISSLLEESSDITPTPFDPISVDFSALKSDVVPKIPRRTHGLSETSSTVSRSSGFYSIQNPKKKAKAKTKKGNTTRKPLLVVNENAEKVRKRKISGTYQLSQKDSGFIRDRLSSDIFESLDPSRLIEESELAHLEKPRVTGSYQFVRSDLKTGPDTQKKKRKKAKRGVFDKLIGRTKPVENTPESEDSTWYTDKPEGDKYWTFAADDSQKKDTSLFTLFWVWLVLSFLIVVILWKFNFL